MWSTLRRTDVIHGNPIIYKDLQDTYLNDKRYRNLTFQLREEYDGCDSLGPKGLLYDMLVTWTERSVEHHQVWHREDWPSDDNSKPEGFYMLPKNDYYLSNLLYSLARSNDMIRRDQMM